VFSAETVEEIADSATTIGSRVAESARALDDGILAHVPIISIFFGIVVRMYFREHEPKHFHAEHQSQEGKFDFDGNQLVGNISSRNALGLIDRIPPLE
jgi:hypothetical protein